MVKPSSLSKLSKVDAFTSAPKVARKRALTKINNVALSTLDQGDSEKRILLAARKEFIAKGLEGARMQAIASDAKVNKALLHYYFRSKEKLYRNVLEDTLTTIWGKLAIEFKSQNQTEGLEALLLTAVTTYIRTLANNPDFPLFIFREIANGGAIFKELFPEILHRFREVPTTLLRLLAEETKAGKLKPILPVHFFMNLMGMTVSTFLVMPLIQKMGPTMGVEVAFDEAFFEARIRIITDTLLNGIRIKR